MYSGGSMRTIFKRMLIFILLVTIVLPASLLTACGHQHTFSSTWSFDDNYHWRKATCEHDEVADRSLHQNAVREEIVGDDIYDVTYCPICGKEKGRVLHIHTFDTASWSKDEHQHWHAATCRHTSLRIDLADHVLETICFTIGEDDYDITRCVICGYEVSRVKHEHTFSEEWDNDEHEHWHNATCIHIQEKANVESHRFNYALVEENGEFFDVYTCSTCHFVRKVPHEHTFEKEFVYDEDYHWHPSSCGHDDAVEKLPHIFAPRTYSSVDGEMYEEYCKECGYVTVKKPH